MYWLHTTYFLTVFNDVSADRFEIRKENTFKGTYTSISFSHLNNHQLIFKIL